MANDEQVRGVTRDEVIRMALKTHLFDDDQEPCIEHLERFAALVAAAEREGCAMVFESLAGKQWVTREASLECSDAIRARGHK